MPLRALSVALCTAFVAFGFVQPAQSQAWPQRPVRIIVPFGPGGHSDTIARIVAQRLGETIGGQFIVENRPGATGIIAAEAVARAPADGYTLFMAGPAHVAIIPAIKKVPYDAAKDFVPVTNIAAGSFALAVRASLPPNTIKELIDYAKQQPKRLTFVSSGIGGTVHLASSVFLNRAGIQMDPVNYRGGTTPITDVIAGNVDMYIANLSAVLPYKINGQLKILAVTSPKRSPQAPDVPTMIEAGLPGVTLMTWNGLLAPTGTPKEAIDRIAHEVAVALKDPKFVERFSALGVEPLGSGPDEFAATIKADLAVWADAVKLSGAAAEPPAR